MASYNLLTNVTLMAIREPDVTHPGIVKVSAYRELLR